MKTGQAHGTFADANVPLSFSGGMVS